MREVIEQILSGSFAYESLVQIQVEFGRIFGARDNILKAIFGFTTAGSSCLPLRLF